MKLNPKFLIFSNNGKIFLDDKSKVGFEIPSPFKRNFYWPEEVKTKAKRQLKEKVPSVATSEQWNIYFNKKTTEKAKKEEEKQQRLQKRKTAQEERVAKKIAAQQKKKQPKKNQAKKK